MRTSRMAVWGVVAAFLAGIPGVAHARIKLITLPVRERVEIQLDNPNATLVEEERIVPLVKGENQVDFSWANTQIDSESIVFRVIAPVGEKNLDVKVLSVSYPPNEASLVWAVGSSDSGALQRVRNQLSILGNLGKSFNYRKPWRPTMKRARRSPEFMRAAEFRQRGIRQHRFVGGVRQGISSAHRH